LTVLFTNVFQVAALTSRVDQLAAQIRPALQGSAAREFEEQAALVKERITRRAASVARQLAEPELKPLQFTNDVARLGPWRVVDAPAGGRLGQDKSPDGLPALHIKAGPVTAASWRARVLLERGRYRFEGAACVAGVVPLKFGKNLGAGLRVATERQPQPYRFIGDSSWQHLAVDLEVTGQSEEVELACELRATQGDAWFELDSLRLRRLP
jgi:hypothetical protein